MNPLDIARWKERNGRIITRKMNKANRGEFMKNEEVFKKLWNYHARLATVINELEILEDFENADCSDILTDIGYCTALLEQRREQLQRRGRRL